MTASRRVALLVALLLVVPGVGAGAGIGTDHGAGATAPSDAWPARADVAPGVAGTDGRATAAPRRQVNDSGPAVEPTPVRHENPAVAAGEGDVTRLRDHLAGALAARLADSTVRLSRGEYDRARSVLGDDYDDSLGKLVEVEGDTAAGDGDGVADDYRETREAQRAYVGTVESYRETLDDYREANRSGERRRARQLARDLDRIADDVSRLDGRVRDGYRAVENGSGADLDAASDAIATTTADVEATRSAAVTAQFVPTRLDLAPTADRVSFADPLSIAGRLTAANGSAVADRRVRLRVGGEAVTTRTDADGSFEATYRPVRAATGPQALRVAYVPDAESLYLEANASVDATVLAVTPTLTTTDAVTTARFDDTASATGRLTAAGTGVANAPVALAVDDRVVARGSTGPNGSYALAGRLPATVPIGARSLTVAVAQRYRAVARATAETALTVRETATAVDVDAERAAPDAIRVRGRLRTRDGRAIPDRPVQVSVDGDPVATVGTDADGRFATTVDRPASAGGAATDAANGSVVATVAFDGEGTNLASATGRATVARPAAGTADPAGDAPGPLAALVDGPLPAVVAGLVAVAFAAGGVRRYLRGPARADDDANDGRRAGGADAGPGADRDGPSTAAADAADADDPLEPVRDALADGRTDAAVEAAYVRVRGPLADVAGGDPNATHWEFYADCAAAGVDGIDALEALTVAYEAAAFGPDSATRAQAADALAAAERLLP